MISVKPLDLFNLRRASRLHRSPLGLLLIFDEVYADVTRTIALKIFEGEFENRKELFNLILEFDGYYREAKDAYFSHNRDRVPAVWDKVFQAVGAGQPPLRTVWRKSVLEVLVLPIIVHLVHDLPLAISRRLQAAPDQWPTQLRDYDKINDLLDQGIRNVQRQILAAYSPALLGLSALAGQNDESLLAHLLRLLRGTTWYDAVRLFSNSPQAAWLIEPPTAGAEQGSSFYPVELDRVPDSFLGVLNTIEKRTDSYLNFILNPSTLMLPLRLLFWGLRLCDTLYLTVAWLLAPPLDPVEPAESHFEPNRTPARRVAPAVAHLCQSPEEIRQHKPAL
jgi:hypothetical protein